MNTKMLVVVGLLLLANPVLRAQNDTCPEVVRTALESANTLCASTGRNQACYGNFALEVEPKPGADSLDFTEAGDVTDVSALQSLRTLPLDPESGTWGVALLRLQANLPDTLPGQNVTFLLFGDTEITEATPAGGQPMRAFYLRSGIGDSRCVEAPESGMVVQTPNGASSVSFTINGVEVAMGSTIHFQAEAGNQMTVRALEGRALIRAAGSLAPVIRGTQVRVPIDEELMVSDVPFDPEPYDLDVLDDLPLDLLEREVEIDDPISDEELDTLLEWLYTHTDLCEDDPFDMCAMAFALDEFDAEMAGWDDFDDADFEDFDDEDFDNEDFDDEDFDDEDFDDEDFDDEDFDDEDFDDEDSGNDDSDDDDSED